MPSVRGQRDLCAARSTSMTTGPTRRRPTRSRDGRPELVAVDPTQPVEGEVRDGRTWWNEGPEAGVRPSSRAGSGCLLAEEHRDALDPVASGVDAGRVSAGAAVDAVPGAIAREEAV